MPTITDPQCLGFNAMRAQESAWWQFWTGLGNCPNPPLPDLQGEALILWRRGYNLALRELRKRYLAWER